jgi:hypothetical protein
MLRFTSRLFCAMPPAAAILPLLRNHTATMAQSVHALQTFAADAAVAKDSLEQIVRLDQTDEQSAAVANGPGRSAVLTAMQAHVNDASIKELCCRCIANMALITNASSSAPNTEAGSSNHQPTIADAIVEANGVEMVLGTLASVSRLSPKGVCWASAALLNLVVKSEDGASRAAAHGGEDTLATCIERVVLDAESSSSSSESSSLFLSLTALDALVGALFRTASTSLPDNDKRLRFRFQVTSFAVLESVVAALKFVGNNFETWRRRREEKKECNDEMLESLAVCCLHKLWETLRQISSHAPNLPLVYDALSAAKVGPCVVSLCLHNSSWVPVARWSEEADDLSEKLFVASIETVTELTSRRHDLAGRDNNTLDAQAILPTEAAQYVVSSLSNGELASRALELLRSVLASAMNPSSPQLPSLRRQREMDVSTRLLSLLLNLSEHDPVVAKKEAVMILRDAIDSYVSTGLPTDSRMALAGRCLSCVWNIANTPDGVEACRAMEVPLAVDQLVKSIDGLLAATSKNTESSAEASLIKTRKSVEKLSEVALRLQSKLAALITRPVYAHTKFEKATEQPSRGPL